jgi:hypothetical protein
VVVLTAAVVFAAAPLAVGGFGGFDPGRFPVPQVDPPVQPAGWAFGIWGVIYLWLIAHAGFGLLRRDVDPAWDRTRLPLIVAMGLGAAWIPIARQSPVLATVMISAMLAAAVLALFRAPRTDRPWAAMPIGLFAGWLTAATGVSIGLLLAGYALTGPVIAAVAALGWTLALAAAILGLRPEPAFAIGAAWALVGIAAANGFALPLVSILAVGGAVALVALAFRPWERADRRP